MKHLRYFVWSGVFMLLLSSSTIRLFVPLNVRYLVSATCLMNKFSWARVLRNLFSFISFLLCFFFCLVGSMCVATLAYARNKCKNGEKTVQEGRVTSGWKKYYGFDRDGWHWECCDFIILLLLFDVDDEICRSGILLRWIWMGCILVQIWMNARNVLCMWFMIYYSVNRVAGVYWRYVDAGL